MGTVSFFTEGINFKLKKPRTTSAWIRKVINLEQSTLRSINYIFCSDEFLLEINKRFLNHATLTDIITFDYSEGVSEINGEIYISIDRIKDNAVKFNTLFDDELHRVVIHGVLHLLGYGDKTKAEKTTMRKKEEACLSLR